MTVANIDLMVNVSNKTPHVVLVLSETGQCSETKLLLLP